MRRRHRPLLLLGSLLASLGTILPGTRAAKREFALTLERDADDYAVRATGDPLSLASAICKAAVTAPRGTAALGGRGAVTMRLHRLIDEPDRPAPVLERSSRSLAILLVMIAVGVIELLVTWMLTAPDLAHLVAIENLPDH